MKRVIVFSSMICALFALSCKDNANDGVEKEVQDVLSENVRNVLIVVE